jgi:antitoxin component YwqK of YwqJK toxin-antitoxin module
MSNRYKIGKHENTRVLITLDVNSGDLNNEERNNVYDSNYALFRTTKINNVILINNSTSNTDLGNAVSFSHFGSTPKTYITGKSVTELNFESNINIVYGKGIFYFKTIDPAFYYMLDPVVANFNGIYKQWHANGSIKIDTEYNTGKINGEYISYYSNGQINIITNYIDDKINGSFKSYYENGANKITTTYNLGKINGAYNELHINGIVYINTSYIENKLNGDYTELYSTNKKYIETTYNLDKINGTYNKYYPNGNPFLLATYTENVLNGPYKKYYNINGVSELFINIIYVNGNI